MKQYQQYQLQYQYHCQHQYQQKYIGNVEVASAALTGDVLDGLHDQVRRTLSLLYGFKERVGRSKSFFWCRGRIGRGRQAAAGGAKYPYRHSQEG